MKTIIILLIFPLSLCSQIKDRINPLTKRVEYSATMEVNEKAKAEVMYYRALTFIIKNFIDSRSVIQLADYDNGQILGKGIVNVVSAKPYYLSEVHFFFSIYTRENRFKYKIENIEHHAHFGTNLPSLGEITKVIENPSQYTRCGFNRIKLEKLLDSIDFAFELLIMQLNLAMNSKIEIEKEW